MSNSARFSAVLGETLRNSRIHTGMSQAALAAKARVSKRFLRDLEHGRTDVSVANLSRIAQELGLSLSDLFGQVESELSLGFQTDSLPYDKST
jgi:transcriptional regulator with XRE-family HTH domain